MTTAEERASKRVVFSVLSGPDDLWVVGLIDHFAEVDAQAAAMRGAATTSIKRLLPSTVPDAYGRADGRALDVVKWLQNGIANDASRELLKRIEKLEAVAVRAADGGCTKPSPCYLSNFAICLACQARHVLNPKETTDGEET